MATVKVYRYDYFDRLLKHDRRSVDYATADAIAAIGGTILAETMLEIDDRIVPDDGIVRAMDVWSARRPPPGEPRMGR